MCTISAASSAMLSGTCTYSQSLSQPFKRMSRRMRRRIICRRQRSVTSDCRTADSARFSARGRRCGDVVDRRLLIGVGDDLRALGARARIRHHEPGVVGSKELPEDAAADDGALDAALDGERRGRIAASGKIARLRVELEELRKESGARTADAVVGDEARDY